VSSLIRAGIRWEQQHRGITSKMPNSRKKSREFGIDWIVAKSAVER
jgi:hypothetical protein